MKEAVRVTRRSAHRNRSVDGDSVGGCGLALLAVNVPACFRVIASVEGRVSVIVCLQRLWTGSITTTFCLDMPRVDDV
jgi:hypothetical protein